ncbi:hypothetical protein B0A69_04530 [Chryseobacterium shigense]|uniref:Uncharacterized protein n=1 Tax=Chryseobacterium shigense TaxID=297244 RepID=A0A1N7IQ76_9FLAO|nr:hypothetical protein [Chryseobacterium shigense]PQA95647.1 hypothetical protein B0A69_04530 [Chryseobacterium shigense]SIS39131.1 hypothetical protein SAMN05421639_104364 [Chryseobacterium shigense]
MKKIILVSAFGVAGLLSAKGAPVPNTTVQPKEKTEVSKGISEEKQFKEDSKSENETARTCTQWYTIEAPCGAIYYLCGNNYWGTQQLHAAMDYYNDVKCN